MDLCYFYSNPKENNVLKVFLNVLIICLITTGIISGQLSPVLTTGPENGHLIIAGGNLRDTAYQMPTDSKEFYFLRRGQRYDMRTRTVIR